MKDYHIYIFKNIANLDTTVGYVNLKEQFIKNDFVQTPYVLLYLSEDLVHRKEVPIKKIESHIVPDISYTVAEFANTYAAQIEAIRKYNENYGPILSWLEVFQIAIMLDVTNLNPETIASKIKNINKFKDMVNKIY